MTRNRTLLFVLLTVVFLALPSVAFARGGGEAPSPAPDPGPPTFPGPTRVQYTVNDLYSTSTVINLEVRNTFFAVNVRGYWDGSVTAFKRWDGRKWVVDSIVSHRWTAKQPRASAGTGAFSSVAIESWSAFNGDQRVVVAVRASIEPEAYGVSLQMFQATGQATLWANATSLAQRGL